MGKTQLLYLLKPKSICGFICTKMGLVQPNVAVSWWEQPNVAVSWWERYKDIMEEVLNAERMDVNRAIKREFMSKFDLCDLRYKNLRLWTNVSPNYNQNPSTPTVNGVRKMEDQDNCLVGRKRDASSSTQCILLWPRIDYVVPIFN
jgi:hypothetical protein